ncbi:TraB/GumN family protein [Erythrobacteraceae bacterium E2-1 Yellow Sea]|nr:TraB/GumN family protein [Erythrobacteraceae bacterium E2-1 Yellow Sea]
MEEARQSVNAATQQIRRFWCTVASGFFHKPFANQRRLKPFHSPFTQARTGRQNGKEISLKNPFLRRFCVGAAAANLILASAAYADDTAADAVAEPVAENTAPAPAGPAIWKLADEDTTIYLFGTVHALPKEVEWFKGDIADALAASDTIMTEIKMDEGMAAEMQQLVMAKGLLPADQPLRGMMDEEQRTSYDAAMTKLGLPVNAFDRFEPWYAGMMMSMLPLIQQGYSPESGVEKVLMAHATDKNQQALETVDYQIAVFDTLPQDSQMAFLIDAAKNIDEIKNLLDAMVAEWLVGDADDLAKLMNEGMTDPVLAERLLYNRNQHWASWMQQRLDHPGTIFVAVGAGHLAGQNSVQEFLTKDGLEVTRVQ